MADVDVLILSPQFVPELVDMNVDLVISSDARQGSYDDNVHCPCSNAMYQRYTFDWVCAGLFYMRATPAALWFMRQAQVGPHEWLPLPHLARIVCTSVA